MKKCIITLLVCFGLSQITLAENLPFTVKEQEAQCSKGKQNAYMVDIPQAKQDIVEKEWIKLIRKGTKSKIENSGKEFSLRDAHLAGLKTDSLNIYNRIEPFDQGTRLIVFFETSEGFLSSASDPANSKKAVKLLQEFGFTIYVEVIQEELNMEEDKLSSLEKEHNRMIKDKEKMYKTIKLNKHEIETLQHEIDQNRLKAGQGFVQTQDGELRSRSLSPIDKKTKKELDKEAKKLHKKVYKLEAENRQMERDIEHTQSRIDEKLQKVEEQKAVVKSVEGKLQNVKSQKP
ncbi:hypothetical protein AAG747_13800 [Rapidithrix thailandica]|uniref:Uncharacterized protein n=1 Tax=Rapidithrix thailandica TaxID=413964 RepID=A0AAW9S661_9BACT